MTVFRGPSFHSREAILSWEGTGCSPCCRCSGSLSLLFPEGVGMAFPSQKESLHGPEGAGQSPATGAAWEDYLWRSQVLSQHHEPAGHKAGVGVGLGRLGGWLGSVERKLRLNLGLQNSSFFSLLAHLYLHISLLSRSLEVAPLQWMTQAQACAFQAHSSRNTNRIGYLGA